MIQRDFTGDKSEFYRLAGNDVEIVNLAIALGRPLLVEGEPGSGKTKLADAIAAELKLGEPTRIVVKSTHQARDLLFRFDPLKRLVDAQDPAARENARSIWPYIDLGPLGRAIQSGKRCVVLIDEIDKADFDFPNDLLEVLDGWRFQIDELPEEESERCLRERGFGREVKGSGDPQKHPIVVVTSNREKPLPDAFLRRCLYLRVEFPKEPKILEEIVRLNLGDIETIKTDIATAVAAFLQVREEAVAGNVRRPPSTAELVDWVRILHMTETQVAVTAPFTLPKYWQTLVKTHQDQEALAAVASPTAG